jgi:hypothetical protein
VTASLRWRLVQRAGRTFVGFTGDIDERADFAELQRRLLGAVEMHLGGVRRVTSAGTHRWVDFIRSLPAVTELSLTHCSPAVVLQLTFVQGFAGPARVRSFYAVHHCAACDTEQDVLVDAPPDGAEALPDVVCPTCGAAMSLDDAPARYLRLRTHDIERSG